jgi:hypothetical protein
MRGDQVYRVYGLHEGREKDTYFGTFRSIPEAEAKIASLLADERDGRNWAQTYHNRGFVIRPATVETDFEIPCSFAYPGGAASHESPSPSRCSSTWKPAGQMSGNDSESRISNESDL